MLVVFHFLAASTVAQRLESLSYAPPSYGKGLVMEDLCSSCTSTYYCCPYSIHHCCAIPVAGATCCSDGCYQASAICCGNYACHVGYSCCSTGVGCCLNTPTMSPTISFSSTISVSPAISISPTIKSISNSEMSAGAFYGRSIGVVGTLFGIIILSMYICIRCWRPPPQQTYTLAPQETELVCCYVEVVQQPLIAVAVVEIVDVSAEN